MKVFSQSVSYCIVACGLVVSTLACSMTQAQNQTDLVGEKETQGRRLNEVSIMAYNVENLFDNVKDNKDDITYLPLSAKQTDEHRRTCLKITNQFYREECLSFDWSDQLLATKIERVVDVITSIDNGNGPDVLIVEEIENVRILERLMKEINKRIPSSKAYREPILLEGWDDRGIDVGMISRLPKKGEAKIYPVKMNGNIIDSRGIMHAVFELPGGQSLNVFGVHFPSGGNPTVFREAAISALNAELSKLPQGSLAIAGGDFNINITEDSANKLYEQKLGSKWLVSHLIGCQQCVGTEFYNKEQSWSFLDALLFTKNMNGSSGAWSVDVQSINVPHDGPHQTFKGKPNRFSAHYGVSDHWPVYARIRKN